MNKWSNMSKEGVFALFLLFLLVFLSTSLLSITAAQTRQYHLGQEWMKIWINQNGSIDLFYNISITLDSGDNINFVTVAQPQSDFTIGSASDQYGNVLSTSDASSASDYKVQVNLANPLMAGETVWFTVTTNVANMIYEDNETNVGMSFIPTWWSQATVTDLRVSIVLPLGVASSQIGTSANYWDNLLTEPDGRLVVFWERLHLSQGQKYEFGVSFPKEYVQVYVRAGRVHNFNTGLNYTTIQEAINANETLDGQTIRVDAGTYNMVYTLINKSVSLLGEGRENTTIVGTFHYPASSPIFHVTSNNVTISGFTLLDGATGVLTTANYTYIMNCNISNSGYGIYSGAWNNIISNNIIFSNNWGIDLDPLGGAKTNGTRIYGNTIENNQRGCQILDSRDDTIFNNNFLNNTVQALSPTDTNQWGGNYWSDYNGTDSNQDGIGDTPYIIDASNIDQYPLMTQYVIPEFPSFLVIPLFMVATLLVIVIYNRRHLTRAL